MNSDVYEEQSLGDYKACESQFHRELMSVCRKYMNYLSIVSILGILEIVKQESIELEKVATEELPLDKPG
jgi:hypothetical protein